ncbi:MAG: hypothetical protein OEW13_00065 [Nitrospira sp.]|nr:hypothetical protein [Nitrospira sp.]
MGNLTAWVDVAIGLTLVYLGASLFVTVLNEYIAQTLNLRGKQLHDSLKKLISDQSVKTILMQSPALRPFFDTNRNNAPSYLDPNILAQLLVGGLADPSVTGKTIEQVSGAIEKLPDSNLKTQLQALVRTAGSTADTLVTAVSDWINRSLTMLGEGYKRNLQKISFGIGLMVAVVFNLDTVTLTEHLYRDKGARDAMVAIGLQLAEKTSKEAFEKCMALTAQKRKEDASCVPLMGLVDIVQGRNELLGRLPIGWPPPEFRTQGASSPGLSDTWLWTTRAVGWLLTALALSLGAPFWFDLLNKLVNMRHGMRKPEVKAEKESK